MDRFLAKITQLGLSADHVRCSHLAVRKKFQADGRACSTLDLAPFNPEYVVTTARCHHDDHHVLEDG